MSIRGVVLAASCCATLVACGGSSDAAVDLGGDAARDMGTDLGSADLGPDARCADLDTDGHADIGCGGDDCDDHDGLRYPGNTEVCDVMGHDEDCDPSTYGVRDGDHDTYPDATCCNTDDHGVMACGNDCLDSNAGVHPASPEVCNAMDDDCDGMIDEGVIGTFYRDADVDGFGDASISVSGCFPPSGYVASGTDCDDARADVHPGATEVNDGVDNNCNGATDESFIVSGYLDPVGGSVVDMQWRVTGSLVRIAPMCGATYCVHGGIEP